MLGDILDTKRILADVLRSDAFLASVAAVLVEKQAQDSTVSDPFALRGPAVYTEETLTRLLFPACELLAYNTTYHDTETMAKIASHKIGIRWTALEKDERTATLSAEVLCTATVELLWNPLMGGFLQGAGLVAGPVVVTEEDYSPLLPDAKGAFQKGGVVIVDIATYRS